MIGYIFRAGARAATTVGVAPATMTAMALLLASPALAAPGLPVVSACTGASLPPARLTPLLTNLVTGIFTPLVAVPIVGPGLIAGVGGIVTNAVSGGPIGLDVQTIDPITGLTTGVLVPGTQCTQQAGGFTLSTPKGITIGGNSVDGLGATGLNANAGELGSVALGNSAATDAAAVNAIALGTGATVGAAGTGAVAIGNGATANTAGGVAIGAGSVDKAATPTAGATIGGTAYTFAGATPTSVVSVGAAGAERQIANVAAGQLGATSTDAVNGSQLFATNTAVNANTTAIAGNTTAITNLSNGAAGPVQQSGIPGRLVAVAPGATGAAPGAAQQLGNIAPGAITPGSTDAVDGGQLATTNAQVAANTGAITTNSANIAGNTTAITNLGTGITNGTIGLVQQVGGAPGAGVITVGAATGGTNVNVAGTEGNRTISGVAAGVAPTDAANVGQLTGAIGAATANVVQYDTVGGVRANSVTLAGGAGGPVTVTNVAAGALTPGSTDAVNGGQLAATNATVAGNTTAITNINNGAAGPVQQSGVANRLVVVAPGATGAAPGAAQQLGNVAPGSVAVGSTDAVDGGQLFATNTQVAANTTSIAGNTTAITNLTGGTAGTVQRTATANTLALTAAGGTGAAPGAAQVLSNVAPGVAATDAVDLGQVGGLIAASSAAGPVQYSNPAAPTTPTPGVVSNSTTLVGTAPGTAVALHNVAAGALTPASTDGVNGSQLAATNGQVAANTAATTTNTANIAGNTTAITNLTNGTAGLVQQTGGAPGNGQITVGAASGGTSVSIAGTGGNRTLTGVAPGLAGNDAVTVAQVNGLTGGGLNNVQYDPTAIGGRSNTITLAGGAAGGVRVTNVLAGALTPASTDAVNGGQLAATNAAVAGLTGGTAGAFQSNNAAGAAPPVASGANAVAGGFGATATGAGGVAVGNGAASTGTGSVALGQGSTDGGATRVVSVGSAGAERRVTNVGAGVNGTDAVNLSQLQAATTSFGATTAGLQNQVTGLQGQLNQTNFDLNQVRRRANGGTAGAMAVAGLPQAFEPGKSMIGGAVGYWSDQVAFAIGVSSVVGEHAVVKAGGSISNQGVGGFNAGVGFQF